MDLTKKDHLIKIINMIDEKSASLLNIYQIIVRLFREIIKEERKKAGYYHNKFFKNEGNLTVLRQKINSLENYKFVSTL